MWGVGRAGGRGRDGVFRLRLAPLAGIVKERGMTPARIRSLYRYPIKGLSAESLKSTRLAPGATLPADRLYAVENGPCGFDPAAPAYFPKIRFLMLMKNESLARLTTQFDEATHVLTIRREGHEAARGDLRTR
jgi:MOSC domain-containing protein